MEDTFSLSGFFPLVFTFPFPRMFACSPPPAPRVQNRTRSRLPTTPELLRTSGDANQSPPPAPRVQNRTRSRLPTTPETRIVHVPPATPTRPRRAYSRLPVTPENQIRHEAPSTPPGAPDRDMRRAPHTPPNYIRRAEAAIELIPAAPRRVRRRGDDRYLEERLDFTNTPPLPRRRRTAHMQSLYRMALLRVARNLFAQM